MAALIDWDFVQFSQIFTKEKDFLQTLQRNEATFLIISGVHRINTLIDIVDRFAGDEGHTIDGEGEIAARQEFLKLIFAHFK